MAITLGNVPTVSIGDTEIVSIDYTDWLDGSEVLTGTPTVAEQGTSDLTIDNVAINTASTVTINGRVVAIDKAIQFRVSGQAEGAYRIRVTCSTDGSPARTAVREITFKAN